MLARALLGVFLLSACAAPYVRPVDDPAIVGIRAAWQQYVEARVSNVCMNPSPLWRTAEQRPFICLDYSTILVPRGASATLLSITRADSLAGELYKVQTRFVLDDPASSEHAFARDITATMFAVREADRWVFSSPLQRYTRTWRREKSGPIVYVLQPGQEYDPARAARAVAWCDSIARVFGVPMIDELEYFIMRDRNEMFRAMGVESKARIDSPGGMVGRYQLFSGAPSVGEDYRHELAHLLLMPLTTMNTSSLTSEAVATWLGGTSGLTFRESVRGLAHGVDRNSALTLDSLMVDPGTSEYFRPAGALLVDMAYRIGGIAAVKDFFSSGPDAAATRRFMELLSGRTWTEITALWGAELRSYR